MATDLIKMLIIWVMPILLLQIVSVNKDSSQVNSAITYDEVNGLFSNFSLDISGADSLLSIAQRLENENPQKASHAALQALELSKTLNYSDGIADSYNSLGSLYIIFGDYDLALEYLLEALDMYQEKQDIGKAGHTQNKIATVHVMQENFEQASRFFQSAIDQLREIGNLELTAQSLMNLGVVYYYMGDYDRALEYYELTREMTESEVDFPRLNMVALTNIGNVLIEMERYDEAEEYLKTAIQFFDENSYYVNLSGSYLYLAKLYNRKSNYEEALIYAERGRDIALSISQSQYTLEGYEMTARVYENLGNYEKAHEQFKLYHKEYDEVLSIERANQISQMQIKFDVEQKDQQIELLNKEAALNAAQLSEQKLWRNFLITGLIFLGIILTLLFRLSSQRKRANELLNKRQKEIKKQNKKLLQLNEEKNQFIGIAAHDLRNPLSSIVGITDLLETSKTNEKETQTYLEIIRQSSDRMLGMINNFLDVNAVENGLSGTNLDVEDAQQLLQQIYKSHKSKADYKGIHLEADLDNEPIPVLLNRGNFRSIMDNLLSNAIKFSEKGSTVTLSTNVQKERVEIRVIDNGPGISEADQKKLFKRFSRLSNKPTGNESSTGLGLYIVKSLTEAMNGTIDCKSKVNEGTTFVITFSLVRGAKRIEK